MQEKFSKISDLPEQIRQAYEDMKSFVPGEVVRSSSYKATFSSPEETHGNRRYDISPNSHIVLLTKAIITSFPSFSARRNVEESEDCLCLTWFAFTNLGCVWVRAIVSKEHGDANGFFIRV